MIPSVDLKKSKSFVVKKNKKSKLKFFLTISNEIITKPCDPETSNYNLCKRRN